MEKYAEMKIDRIAEIKVKYESEVTQCRKKVLPAKLKVKLIEKLEKEERKLIDQLVEDL